jgi:uncharacterized repeat protein (TIGR02543 family)
MFSGMYFDASGNELTYANYGATSGVQSSSDGYSTFGLNNAGGIINGFAFDAGKPVYIDYSYRLINENNNWMMFTLCDSLSASYISRATRAATNELGALAVFGHAADAAGSANVTVWRGGASGGVPIPDYKLTENDSNKQYNRAVVYIGETAADSYVEINGARVVELNLTQADFADGKIYFTIGSFVSTVVHVRITQEFDLGLSFGAGGDAEIAGGLDAVKFGDEVNVTVTPDAGYMTDKFTVNGADIFENAVIADNGDGSFTFKFYMPFADTEVAVSFAELRYRVRFDVVYLTDLYDYQLVTPGQTAAKPADPARAGYTFGGWFTDTETANEFDFAAVPTCDLRLYAKWTVRTYTLTLMSAGQLHATAAVQGANKRFSEPEVQPVREGYTFGGWYTDEACTELYNFNAIVTDDVTLYAKWTAESGSPDEESPDGGCGCGGKTAAANAAMAALLGLTGLLLLLKKRGE